jgi:hypothetical protein
MASRASMASMDSVDGGDCVSTVQFRLGCNLLGKPKRSIKGQQQQLHVRIDRQSRPYVRLLGTGDRGGLSVARVLGSVQYSSSSRLSVRRSGVAAHCQPLWRGARAPSMPKRYLLHPAVVITKAAIFGTQHHSWPDRCCSWGQPPSLGRYS